MAKKDAQQRSSTDQIEPAESPFEPDPLPGFETYPLPAVSFAPQPRETVATVKVHITNIGMKIVTVPVSEVDILVQNIMENGFSLDNGPGRRVIYPVTRIEKIEVCG